MIEINGDALSFSYPDGAHVFNNLSFRLGGSAPKGQVGRVVCLMGVSGCGKSTLLRLLAGLETPSSGRIYSIPEPSVIPYLNQEAVLLPHYSRRENARYRQFAGRHRARFDEDSFRELSLALGLDEAFLDNRRPMAPMSGGQRQRLALLRDLSLNPDLLLLDEPCVGLDSPVKLELLQQIRRIIVKRPILIIYVTHHSDEVAMVGDDIAFMDSASEGDTHLLVGPARDFFRMPYSLSAAKLLGKPGSNVLRCRAVGGNIHEVISLEDEPQCSDTIYLVLGPENFTFTQDGWPVEISGRTPFLAYARMSVGGQALALSVPRDWAGLNSIAISGMALAYKCGLAMPTSVMVETTSCEGNQCLRITPM
jgi:ABC-type sugar transport system ATPase subunit